MADPIQGGWKEDHHQVAKAHGYTSWEAWIAEIEQRRGFAICGAKSGPKGDPIKGRKPCGSKAGAGVPDVDWGRCSKHGGKSLNGPASGTYTHGKLSKVNMRGRFGKAYERAGEFQGVNLDTELQLMDAQVIVLAEDIDDGDVTPTAYRGKIKTLISLAKKAAKSGDVTALIREVVQFETMLKGTDKALTARVELRKVIEGKRKLVDTHTKQAAREFGPVSWLDMLTIVDTLVTMVRGFIPPERSTEFERLVEAMLKPPTPLPLSAGTPLDVPCTVVE